MALTIVTVQGKHLLQDGVTPGSGTVVFKLNQPLQSTEAGDVQVVSPTPVTATLDGSGEYSVDLVATTGIGVGPLGATYHVTETIGGVVSEYDIVLPHSPLTTDIATIPRVTNKFPSYQYVEYQEYAARMEYLKTYLRESARFPMQHIDIFDQGDGPLSAEWIDAHDELPNSFEPLGIKSGGAVVRVAQSRSGVYEVGPPYPDVIPQDGKLFHGIGCAYRDFGTRSVSAQVVWNGLWNENVDGIHVEGTPLIHVTPGTTRFGFGCWLGGGDFGAGFKLYAFAGHICDPPEQFGNYVLGVKEIVGVAHGDDVLVRLESNGEEVRIFINDVEQTSGWAGAAPSYPFPLHESLKYSTMHGFALDAHLTDLDEVPNHIGIHSVILNPVFSTSQFGVGDGLVGIEPDVSNSPNVRIYSQRYTSIPAMALGAITGGPGLLSFGTGLITPDTILLRGGGAGRLNIIDSGGTAGYLNAGQEQSINAVTSTAYTHTLDDGSRIVSRNNASASTHKWPSNTTAPIPVGTRGIVVNIGAGTITHSADTGATLVTGSRTSQVQGSVLHWAKTGTNTFILW